MLFQLMPSLSAVSLKRFRNDGQGDRFQISGTGPYAVPGALDQAQVPGPLSAGSCLGSRLRVCAIVPVCPLSLNPDRAGGKGEIVSG